MQVQEFSIRAMPPTGYERRFRAGRPWGKEPVIVKVVEKPAKPRVDTDRDGKTFTTYNNEISPADLESLRNDRHIAVTPVGASDGAAMALNSEKARVGELLGQIEKLKLELQGAVEEHKAFRAGVVKDSEEQAKAMVKLQQELKDAQAALTSTKRTR